MFGFNRSQPLLEQEQQLWMFDVFQWCLDNFSADYFFNHSELIIPSNQFFPGRADSTQQMAELIFNHVKRHAGISHWPTEVQDQTVCSIENQPVLDIEGPIRQLTNEENPVTLSGQPLLIPYNAQQIGNPEGLIASFSHITAHYMGQMAKQPPPGGPDFWPHTTEVLAIFLGFGLMFANSAYTFRGGCGSCYNPNANRDAYLSEQQSTYALALFAVLKNLPNASVTSHLKKHLRGFYKKAVKEINQQGPRLEQLTFSA